MLEHTSNIRTRVKPQLSSSSPSDLLRSILRGFVILPYRHGDKRT